MATVLKNHGDGLGPSGTLRDLHQAELYFLLFVTVVREHIHKAKSLAQADSSTRPFNWSNLNLILVKLELNSCRPAGGEIIQ
jgi:hypothetical protein